MALHRKQRGSVDASPQYVRIPMSRASSRTAGHTLHEAQPHARRVYAKRYVAGDRSRKISSLQLRACFVLCVLLYFGAIYFADDIATLGRVVGSEQNSKSFFVHSLRPRGRGRMRVGRAVDAKRMETTLMPTETAAIATDTTRTEQDDPPSEMPKAETQSPQAEPDMTARTNEVQATGVLRQKEVKIIPEDRPAVEEGDLGDGVHPDDQGEEQAGDTATDTATTHVEANDGHDEARKWKQKDPIESPVPKQQHQPWTEPQPTAAHRHPDKEGGTAMPAASPARVEKHIRGPVDGYVKRVPRVVESDDRKPQEAGEGKQDHDLLQRRSGRTRRADTPAGTPPPRADKDVTEHISDI